MTKGGARDLCVASRSRSQWQRGSVAFEIMSGFVPGCALAPENLSDIMAEHMPDIMGNIMEDK